MARSLSVLEVLLIIFILIVVALDILLLLLLLEETFTPECPKDLPESERIDCAPGLMVTEAVCVGAYKCCWGEAVHSISAPKCFFPRNWGYVVSKGPQKNSTGLIAELKKVPSPALFGNDTINALFTAEYQTSRRFHFKITDFNNRRYEVPLENITAFNVTASPDNMDYCLEINHKPFSLKVTRTSNMNALLDSSIGPLQFADQYLQLSFRLPKGSSVYGLGEHVHGRYRHSMEWKTWPIFARNATPIEGMRNLYGAHTFLLCLEDTSGSSFGIFLMNSNAMEVTLQPAPAITYRTIGGILDFYVFLGNTPEQVVQEYLELIGRPFMPPYWSLGFQLGSRGYSDITKLENVVERTRAAGVPCDAQYFDIDYMDANKDFTINNLTYSNLSKYVEKLHNYGLKSVIIMNPGIFQDDNIAQNDSYKPYKEGTQKRIWIMDNYGFAVGKGYPGLMVFPDFSDPICTQWWKDQFSEFYKNVKFDGVWIEGDELSCLPRNSSYMCEKNSLNNPPFIPRVLDRMLFEKTLCMDTEMKSNFHYNFHSIYGYLMAIATDTALKNIFHNNRSFILSRSTFAGSGKFAAHWLGDNAATWDDLQWSIPSILEFNLFGIPLVGANICGYRYDSTEELCRRWMQLGAFYPLSRNYNGPGYRDQDPAFFGQDSQLLRSSRHYLHIRYSLLPYLYTLFYWAHTRGDTVARPLVHEFYEDPQTWDVHTQFLWGPGLLITPVLGKNVAQVSAYVPDAIWYDYETGEAIPWRKQRVELQLPGDKLGLHLRGGYIFPTQKPSVTTKASRTNSLGLIIALDYKREAKGELYWDDGVSADAVAKKKYILYEFSVSSNCLQANVILNNSNSSDLKFTDIIILGLDKQPVNFTVTPDSSLDCSYDASAKVVNLTNLTNLMLGQSFNITWTFLVKDNEKFNCFPDNPPELEQICLQRGCIWEATNASGVPQCYYDTIPSYAASDIRYTPSGISLQLTHLAPPASARAAAPPPPRAAPAAFDPFSAKIRSLTVSVIYHTETMLQFKIFDSDNKRYEVPMPLNIPPSPIGSPENRLYNVVIQNNPFGIKIQRKSSNTVIWDSQLPGFTFNDMFLSISTRLPSHYIYGLGESEHKTFRKDMNWKTWGMFARGEPPANERNSYGVHPYYMALEQDGNAHGVLLLNSNAMDVTLQPLPALTYRTTGGIWDFYMILGPTPELVTQQYTELIGRPAMIPYWALGFQLSLSGLQNNTEITSFHQEMMKANITFDVLHVGPNYRDRKLDFTLSPNFQNLGFLIEDMKKTGTRFILVLDPAISGNETAYPTFRRGQENDVFIKWPNSNDIVWGKTCPLLPGVTVDESLDHETQVKLSRAHVAFPDFLRKSTAAWWKKEIEELYENPGKPEKSLKFDGLWIDMNEPLNFVNGSVRGCRDEVLNKPPYMPFLGSRDRALSSGTLCMDSEQVLPDGSRVQHYDVHSLYGWAQARHTYEAVQEVTRQRGVVITRSTFPSSGRWGGHSLGDNKVTWQQMKKSIIEMMEFSLFGIPYTGADIRGDLLGDDGNEMYARWMQLGAFYPLSRMHIGSKWQHPVAWDFMQYTKQVLQIRYSLLPYFYTLMHKAHVEGSTVIRPLLHEFTNDNITWNIDSQFMLGPAILFSPVLENDASEVRAYFPKALWYEAGITWNQSKSWGEWRNLSTPLNHINLHIRGGHILPCQRPGQNTRASRRKFMGLIVALDENEAAKGQMFWDDGESIDAYKNGKYFLADFTASQNILQIHIIYNEYLSDSTPLNVGYIDIMGINTYVSQVSITYNNQQFMETNFCYSDQTLTVNLTNKSIRLEKLTKIMWMDGGPTVPATTTSTTSTTSLHSSTYTTTSRTPVAVTSSSPFTSMTTATTETLMTSLPETGLTTENTTTTIKTVSSTSTTTTPTTTTPFSTASLFPATTTIVTPTSTVPNATPAASPTTEDTTATATTTPFPIASPFPTTTTIVTTTSTVPNAIPAASPTSENTTATVITVSSTSTTTTPTTTTPFSTASPFPTTTTIVTTTSTAPNATPAASPTTEDTTATITTVSSTSTTTTPTTTTPFPITSPFPATTTIVTPTYTVPNATPAASPTTEYTTTTVITVSSTSTTTTPTTTTPQSVPDNYYDSYTYFHSSYYHYCSKTYY
ncbi:PREDICTED: putative maltase-glucoamylase-like protein FLJ16351 [Condylura cristata]|uniref:putative maltase-glucoamylase-like protein FLJ16351 n=1 Tax=Condylura cristata TaxID=143302 RepID=UPI000643CD39|nr:PREDICTED: putative maltase-glucoamylase-like protein FLJ16351 [Condylura cristata]